MAGLARIAKVHGGITVIEKGGKEVQWLFDYVQNKPRLKSEMSKEEIEASKIRRIELANKK